MRFLTTICTMLSCCGFFFRPLTAFPTATPLRRGSRSFLTVVWQHRSKSTDHDVTFETSLRHVHVGNLDWKLEISEIVTQLSDALSSTSRPNSITVKPIKKANRKRDYQKYHGGSAILAFDTEAKAQQGFAALNAVSNNYRVKYPAILKRVVVEEEQAPLSKERLQLRKERAAAYARRRVRVAQHTDQIMAKLQSAHPYILKEDIPVVSAKALDWTKCCPQVDPMQDQGAGLKPSSQRAARKRAAVEAFLPVVQALSAKTCKIQQSSLVVADLGCGTGNLALPLQWWLEQEKQQHYRMVGVDRNGQSLERLERRAGQTGLSSSVQALQADLMQLISSGSSSQGEGETLLAKCNMVVSLHACGAASDMAMATAVARSIPFAISPCCIGKVNQWYNDEAKTPNKRGLPALDDLSYPRSQWLQNAVSIEEYKLLAKAADYGVIYDNATTVEDAELQRRSRCRMAKRIVEMDRLQWAKEHGYEVRLVELPRIGPLYPKRELLLGALTGSEAAGRMKELLCSSS